MPKQELILDQARIRDFCIRWKIRELALFGSALGPELRADSDLDFLVSFVPGVAWDLTNLASMREELQGLTGRSVDLVERAALRNPFRKREILRHHRVLYAA